MTYRYSSEAEWANYKIFMMISNWKNRLVSGFIYKISAL